MIALRQPIPSISLYVLLWKFYIVCARIQNSNVYSSVVSFAPSTWTNMISMFSLIQLNQRCWAPKDTQDGFNLLEVIQRLFEPRCSFLEMHGEMRVCALNGFLKMPWRSFDQWCWKVSHSPGSGSGNIPINMYDPKLTAQNRQPAEFWRGCQRRYLAAHCRKICFDKVLHHCRSKLARMSHMYFFVFVSTHQKLIARTISSWFWRNLPWNRERNSKFANFHPLLFQKLWSCYPLGGPNHDFLSLSGPFENATTLPFHMATCPKGNLVVRFLGCGTWAAPELTSDMNNEIPVG